MGNALRFHPHAFYLTGTGFIRSRALVYTHLEWVFRERTGAINDLNTVIL